MSPQDLAALVMALPLALDFERPRRMPIPRPAFVAPVVAEAAASTSDPAWYAEALDRIAAHESGYLAGAVGDIDRETGVARSCGAFQTLCPRTPGFTSSGCAWSLDPGLVSAPGCRHGWLFTPARGVALAQARVAVSVLEQAAHTCPEHPIWAYGSGHCAPAWVTRQYEAELSRPAP